MTTVGVDLIEIERVRRALARYPRFRERCFTDAERAYCDSRPNPAQSYAGRFAGKEAVGKALGFGVARAFAWREIEIAGRPKPSVRLSGRIAAWAEKMGAGSIDLSMTHSRELANAVAVVDDRLMFQPLYTAGEMRAAEQGHDVEELMERAGRAVAEAVLRRYPDARRIAAVCGKGANGGDGRIALRLLAESGRETAEELDGDFDLVIDALFGTGFHGEPRPDAAALIGRINRAGVPVIAVDVPSGVDASTGETPGAAVRAALTVTMHAPKVGLVVAPGRFHAGEVEVADIGLEQVDTEHRLATEELLRLVPRRSEGDTKYTRGRCSSSAARRE